MRAATGFDVVRADFPARWRGKRVAVLCHAPSIAGDLTHIIDYLGGEAPCRLAAVFGPQHGVSGQTQDNMIEWEGFVHPVWNVPVYSLYGLHRKPTAGMLKDVDVLLVDLQDVGCRVYTYVWTLRLCMERCAEMGIEVAVLDRPNPAGALAPDGAVLDPGHYTFVGMARIPLCHGMTMGELALFLQRHEVPECKLTVVSMLNYKRGMSWAETGLPWVPPSPNMPTERTSIVYPGAVLIEALNLSEARGTTTPFELFGAPFVRARELKAWLDRRGLPGCGFRIHDYIPTFHKFSGRYCEGLFVHVTDIRRFRPVRTFAVIFKGIIETSDAEALKFLPPPYEYEDKLMPFDILAGDSGLRAALCSGAPLEPEFARWDAGLETFAFEPLYGC